MGPGPWTWSMDQVHGVVHGGPWTGSMGWSMDPGPCFVYVLPATVRSLKTKTFVILDSPNEVLLSPEILLHHDNNNNNQIFSFLPDSLKSILDHYKGARETSKAWIQSNELAL